MLISLSYECLEACGIVANDMVIGASSRIALVAIITDNLPGYMYNVLPVKLREQQKVVILLESNLFFKRKKEIFGRYFY